MGQTEIYERNIYKNIMSDRTTLISSSPLDQTL